MPKTAGHLVKHQFKPGHPGGPGRPVGSRAKLAELAAKMLLDDFTEHGVETIRRVRERKPEVYLASVVTLMPKQAQKLDSPFIDLSDEELEQLEQLLAAMRAKTVSQLTGRERANRHRCHRCGQDRRAVVSCERCRLGVTVTSDAGEAGLNGQGNEEEGDDRGVAAPAESEVDQADGQLELLEDKQ